MAEKKKSSESLKTLKVKGLFALVVYVKPGNSAAKKKSVRAAELSETFFDVLELAQIPKNHRVVGDRTRVTWIDAKPKKTSCHYVTIKKISDNRDELLTLCPIDASTEEIVSPQTKIISAEIIGEKKEKQLVKKAEKVACLAARKKIEEKISKDLGIWGDATVSDCTPGIVKESIEKVQNKTSPTPCGESSEDAVRHDLGDEEQKGSMSGPFSDEKRQCESTYSRFWATMKELAVIAIPANIAFLESVVISLKASSTPLQDTPSVEEKKLYEIPERFLTPGKHKEPIFEGIPFYLYSGLKIAFEAKSVSYNVQTRERTKNWRLLVRQCLVEVYGKHLTAFSAKGMKEGHRPAIDHDLYKGLLYWARKWYEDDIDEEDYVKLINKTAYNKRKAEVQRKKKEDEKEKPGARIQKNEENEEEKRGVGNKNETREDQISDTLKESRGNTKETKESRKSEKAAVPVSSNSNSLQRECEQLHPYNHTEIFCKPNHQHYQKSWNSLNPAYFPLHENFIPTDLCSTTSYENPYFSTLYRGNLDAPTPGIPRPQTPEKIEYHEM